MTERDRRLSRRRLLSTAGAAGAAVAGSALLGGAAQAGAVGGAGGAGTDIVMKWGAVCSPNGDFNHKLDLLRRMRATTVRVSTYWNGATVPRFSPSQFSQLIGTGLTEMILQSSEGADADTAKWQLEKLFPVIDAHRNVLFIWELGNEPDYYDSPTNPGWCRYKRLTAIRNNKPVQSRPNLLWAINMPAGRWDIPNGSGWYFNEFVRDHGDGLGAMLTGQLRPDVVTVHCYGSDRLCPNSGAGEHNPFKMVDWVRGWNPNLSMKITEAGISNPAIGDRGHRYVEFGEMLSARTGGRADSICFYGLPDVEDEYDISTTMADQIGTRARTHLC